jgi:hypothetical protein
LRIYNKYLISLAISTCFINILLAFVGQDDLIIYVITNLIAYLVITLLYAYLNPRTRLALNTISVVSFAGFMVIVIFRVIEIWSGG